jgi:hypothetical protein
MSYYIYAPEPIYVHHPRLRFSRFSDTTEVWQIEDKFAVRIGVDNPPRYEAAPGETIWDKLRRQCPAWFRPDGSTLLIETALGPGEFYPRIWRPSVPDQSAALGLSPAWNPSAQHESNIADVIAIARGQLTTFTRQLDRICQTVQPLGQNLDVFGHDIRNLLILACTEAEAHWRNVLVANGVKQERFSTKDYVKLQEPLKLDQYAVTFPNYPWLEAFKPYEKWNAEGPTCSLEWYDAYNAVKHDRETQFIGAKLRHVFDAIAACVIMIDSQFGEDEGLGAGSELRAFFRFSGRPEWPYSDYYIPPYGKDITPVQFDFNVAASQRDLCAGTRSLT